MKILFVGPPGFNPNSWKTRVDYILPDLFSSITSECEIHWLTGPVPDFARQSLSALCKRFSIDHVEIRNAGRYGIQSERWRNMVNDAAKKIRPEVITNSLGSLRLGEAMAYAARNCGARSIIRVAGDEIGSRVAMGKYLGEEQAYTEERSLEYSGFIGADTIIAMSPWEKSRINNIIDHPEKATDHGNNDKVKICIRGVDLSRFYPNYNRTIGAAKRILYVGRKSAEKGYDIIEAAAQLVYKESSDIEFLFVGDFDSVQIENRHYLGWVEAADLPELYRTVDAFVLTSRTEGFPQVVAEGMASGLPCILAKQLFEPIFRNEIDVLLVESSPADVANKIMFLNKRPNLARYLARRSREIALKSLNQEYWRNRYLRLLLGKAVDETTIFDSKIAPATEGFATQNTPAYLSKKTRVLLLLPGRVGALGTPGSYNLAETLNKYVELLTICNSATPKKKANSAPLVHQLDSNVHIIEINFNIADYEVQILNILISFQPDIVHMSNWHGWVSVLPFLKINYPLAKYIIDFKTPLMAEGDTRDQLRDQGNRAAYSTDLVMSRNTEDVDTWIKDNTAPVFIYPLGVALDDLHCRKPGEEITRHCHRFIYIGNFHEKRKISTLLMLIASLPASLLEKIQLDLYGSGGDVEKLSRIIAERDLAERITINDAIPQKELFSLLATYDAGIAWVPCELYDAAPSIKFLEYAGSGLAVVATDTLAHRRNLNAGFHAMLFSENIDSFSAAMQSVVADGYPISKIRKNLDTIKKFSWDRIVQDYFIPMYHYLLSRHAPQDAIQSWMGRCVLDYCIAVPPLSRDSQYKLQHERSLHARRVHPRIQGFLETHAHEK